MRIRLAIAAAALGVCQFHALPAAADDAATIAELKSAVVELDQAYANEDVATIKRMISPDNVSITPRYDGAASVDEQIATFEEIERKHSDYSPIDAALLRPDVALVTFEKSYTGTYKGTTPPPRVFVSELKQGNTWLNRLYQETPIEKQ